MISYSVILNYIRYIIFSFLTRLKGVKKLDVYIIDVNKRV